MAYLKTQCKNVLFSRHTVTRMLERNLSVSELQTAIEQSEVVEEYPNDHPYPSYLLLSWVNDTPVHVVIALNETENACIIITVYRPDREKWSDDFKRRRP
ncbi:MAG: DUF4258 domain-containing protein [Myxococcales bacterium]|nr:MAG: DUF4258 domain-containing protein [Myxococcales bacterium]